MANSFKDKLSLLNDRYDGEKWAHPEIVSEYEGMRNSNAQTTSVYFNMELPEETRREAAAKAYEGMKAYLSQMASQNPNAPKPEVIMAPGCPEEPDTEVELNIYRPLSESKKPRPVLLCAPGGGMYMCSISGIYQKYAIDYNCVCIVPRYRTAFEAKYPGALNDLHAAYKYAIDNAEALNIDPDNIVLQGVSSGSHLILSLAYRLKRYGYSPRGCLANSTLVDNRPIYRSSNIKTGWDARLQWYSSIQYLGVENVSSENNPEMYPIYVTVEDCIGLCPIFIHTEAEDEGTCAVRAYVDKLIQAGVYHELHIWGGTCHSALGMAGVMGDSDHARRYLALMDANIVDCMKYDLRRQWIKEIMK